MPAENQTLKPSFSISPVNTDTAALHLFIQAGRQGISLLQLDTISNTFTSLVVYHFAKQMSDTAIAGEVKEIFTDEESLQHPFKKVDIIWCFEQSILIPHEYYTASNARQMLQLVYGDVTDNAVQSDFVYRHNLHNAYKIPAEVKDVFAAAFPVTNQTQQSSLLIDFDKQQKDYLFCIFYTNQMTVLLRKNNQLQAIQNFEFTTPEDAAYHLINTCRSFDTNAAATVLTASGMIDKDSALFVEVYKYFADIHFLTLPVGFNYAEEINNYPGHYFSHLFVTASCV